MPRFKSIIFYHNSSKIKVFLQKNAKFSSAGGSAPIPPCLQRLGLCPQTPVHSAVGGFAPRPPAYGGWGLRPHTPNWPPAAGGSASRPPRQPRHCEFLVRTWSAHTYCNGNLRFDNVILISDYECRKLHMLHQISFPHFLTRRLL